ncbi:MAG: hypothetical protein J6X65_05790 [Bacteroidales bacterium]|nr:hypothetical protein [Bacteroidales bacterium]
MKKRHALLLFFLFTLILSNAFAQRQKGIEVTGAGTGTAESVTLAKQRALYEAKKDALKAAGIPENIISFAGIMISNDETVMDYTAINEVDILSLNGDIIVENENYFDQTFLPNTDLVRVSVRITAKVFVEEEDETFKVMVEDLKDLYHENDKISFSVNASQDCYLRIFWFDMSSESFKGELIFPHPDYFNDVVFGAGQSHLFPPTEKQILRRGELDFTAEKSTNNPVESSLLLVVALKKNVPFSGDVSWNKVMQWLHKIKPNQRTFIWEKFDVTK